MIKFENVSVTYPGGVKALDNVSLEINEGDLLIFPGYLPHKVAKNESDEDRIVISFNVDIK